jgi:hypothetical protein
MQRLRQATDAVACSVLEESANDAHWGVPPCLLWWHVIWIQLERASSRCDIHLARTNVHLEGSAVNLVSEIENENDGTCEVCLEE